MVQTPLIPHFLIHLKPHAVTLLYLPVTHTGTPVPDPSKVCLPLLFTDPGFHLHPLLFAAAQALWTRWEQAQQDLILLGSHARAAGTAYARSKVVLDTEEGSEVATVGCVLLSYYC